MIKNLFKLKLKSYKKIGYRIYDQKGNKKEKESGRNYFGWSNKHDEELSVTNPRIAM